MNHDRFIVPPGTRVSLGDYDPAYTGEFKSKEDALESLQRGVERLADLQDILYAQDTYALLVIFQAMDASGKDGVIKHVMSGVTPAGSQVYSFKAPSPEELDHDYLWRCYKSLPERGRIGIFNRSYYEEVLVVRVHPEILNGQQLPPEAKGEDVWRRRFEEINNMERHLTRNGTAILKFYLHVSKAEQKRRFLDRINKPEKNWKFSLGDVRERGHWDAYMSAYEDAFLHTSTEHAPWHIIPADHKWFTRAAVADIIVRKLESMPLMYPELNDKHRRELAEAKRILEAEDE
ncbi:MAG TPA: polyphosphate kinase 2 family protein [Pyrinomonadaceae bacterium]|nr:polyphosphate kinase 2 family protein [Pyrinomonadaceae bacterium]